MSWDPKSTALIYNPAAANGSVGRNWASYEDRIKKALGNIRCFRTTGPGDGTAKAAAAVRDGAHTVLSLGGDGTHNEVVNGLMQEHGTAPLTLGVLPAGTGGDFKRLLNHSSLNTALGALPKAERCPLDVGKTTYKDDNGKTATRYFVNIANFGMGGLVDRKVNSSSKALGGKTSFYVGTLKALAEYKPATVRLTIDGQEVGIFTVTNIAVCNGRFAGGGMMFAPSARLGDGIFDVIVLQQGPIHQLLGMTFTIYSGKHLSSPLVRTFQGRHIVAEPLNSNPAWLDLDGEAPGTLPLSIEMCPQALQLLDARPEMR